MTGNASTVSWMNLLIFMGHLLCQTLEKVTEQNRHIPILTVLKYELLKIVCAKWKKRNQGISEKHKKGGSGLRGKDGRSRANCFSWVLIGARISLRGGGIKREKSQRAFSPGLQQNFLQSWHSLRDAQLRRSEPEQQRIVTASADGRTRSKGERPLGSIHPILDSKLTTTDTGYKKGPEHFSLPWQGSFLYLISTSFYLSIYYSVLRKGREGQEKMAAVILCQHFTSRCWHCLKSLPHPPPQLRVLCSAGLWRISFTSTEGIEPE